MTKTPLSNLSIEELLYEFVRLSLQDEEAMNLVKVSVQNRLVRQISDIKNELQRRPGDQRSALVKLFEHPNLQVRYHAATNLMALMPQQARRQMEAIADSKIYPIAGSAGTYLVMLELAAQEAHRS